MSSSINCRGTSWAMAMIMPLCLSIGVLPVPAQNLSNGDYPSAANSTRVVYDSTADISQGSTPLTVDVFWCSGDGNATSRALSASELAASYGILARVDKAEPVLPPIVIRTRPIDKESFASKFSPTEVKASTDKVLLRYDPDDANSKLFAERIVTNGPRPSTVSPFVDPAEPTRAFTPNYVSTFICTDLDTATISGRLYFQVKYQRQTDSAQRAAAQLRTDLPGFSVAKDIEVVGNKAPSNSELRYFFDDDAKIAARVAETISSTTAAPVMAKRVQGYETKVRRGTLEAWITE